MSAFSYYVSLRSDDERKQECTGQCKQRSDKGRRGVVFERFVKACPTVLLNQPEQGIRHDSAANRTGADGDSDDFGLTPG